MWIPEEEEEGPEMKKCELNALKRATERDGGRDTGKTWLQNRTELISLSVSPPS